MNYFKLIVFVMAIWRISSLVANELGPFHMFQHFRNLAKMLTARNRFFKVLHFYSGLECEWCNSLWFAPFFVLLLWIFGDVVIWILFPFAVSTGVIILKYVTGIFETVCEILNLKREEVEKDALRVESKKDSLWRGTSAGMGGRRRH